MGYLVSRVPLISWISWKAMLTLNNTLYADIYGLELDTEKD